MITTLSKHTFSIILFLMLLSSNLFAASKPFFVGEKLVYDLSWYNINAGRAVLKTSKADKGVNALIIRSVARSNSVFSMFFKVEDRVETVINNEKLYPYSLFINQHEGRRRKKKRVFYDHKSGKALTRLTKQDRDVEEKIKSMVPFSHNSLSAFYYLRTIKKLKVGSTVSINVHEGGKNWKLLVDVLAREVLETDLGRFNAVKLKARIQFEGMFMDKGDVYVWLSDDEKRLPLKLYFKISFGKVFANLVDFKQEVP